MNTQRMRFGSITLALGAVTFLGAIATPVRAQEAGTPEATTEPSRPISLNLVNVPVQAALRTLFSSAGIRNYSIKPDVQGFANIAVSEVPFNLALRQLLGSVNPPLTYTVIDGTYIVSAQQPAQALPPIVGPQPASLEPDAPAASGGEQPKRFYTIPINHYDAYVIAQLLAQTSGIIPVPANLVIPSAGGPGGQGGQSGFGGNLSAPVTSIGNGNNSSFSGRPFSSSFGGLTPGGRMPFSIGQSF